MLPILYDATLKPRLSLRATDSLLIGPSFSTTSRSVTASSPKVMSSTASAATSPTTAARKLPPHRSRKTATTSPSPSNGPLDSAERGHRGRSSSDWSVRFPYEAGILHRCLAWYVGCLMSRASTSIPAEQELDAPLRVGRSVLRQPPFTNRQTRAVRAHCRRARSDSPYRQSYGPRIDHMTTPDWQLAVPWSSLAGQLFPQHDAASPRTS